MLSVSNNTPAAQKEIVCVTCTGSSAILYHGLFNSTKVAVINAILQLGLFMLQSNEIYI